MLINFIYNLKIDLILPYHTLPSHFFPIKYVVMSNRFFQFVPYILDYVTAYRKTSVRYAIMS